MFEAMLYQVQVKAMSATRVEITFVPTWLGRLLKRPTRRGIAHRARSRGGDIGWWWNATLRHVSRHVESYIEAAPLLAIEDMTVEQLLLEEPPVPALPGRRRKKRSPAL